MEQNKRNTSANSTTVFIRVIAAGFVFYSLWEIISAFLKGGEDAPSLTLLLLAIAVLGGGGVFIALMAWKEWKRYQAAQNAPAEGPAEETAPQLPEEAEEPEEAED